MGTMNPCTLENVRRMTAVERAVLSVASLSATTRFESITRVSGNGFWEGRSAGFKFFLQSFWQGCVVVREIEHGLYQVLHNL